MEGHSRKRGTCAISYDMWIMLLWSEQQKSLVRYFENEITSEKFNVMPIIRWSNFQMARVPFATESFNCTRLECLNQSCRRNEYSKRAPALACTMTRHSGPLHWKYYQNSGFDSYQLFSKRRILFVSGWRLQQQKKQDFCMAKVGVKHLSGDWARPVEPRWIIEAIWKEHLT